MNKDLLLDLITKRRRELKITQEEIARELKTSRQMISKWENGFIENMPIKYAKKYADLLKIPAVFFINPSLYLESDYLSQDYIQVAKKLEENNIAIKDIENYIELVKNIKLNLFKGLQKNK